MKTLSESRALDLLNELKSKFREEIRSKYEFRAHDCGVCPTAGACCTDAHFVNVRITRLEAKAIRNVLDDLPPARRAAVFDRIAEAVDRYELDRSDDVNKTFACPLFERGTGCLVHIEGKPLPCIHHACYENRTDMPPDELLERGEMSIVALNRRVYRSGASSAAIPIAMKKELERQGGRMAMKSTQ